MIAQDIIKKFFLLFGLDVRRANARVKPHGYGPFDNGVSGTGGRILSA